jgi:hypothetical protein
MEARQRYLLVAAELILLPLLLAFASGEIICSRRPVQQTLLRYGDTGSKHIVAWERVRLDYDLGMAVDQGKRIVFVAGSSQMREGFDAADVRDHLGRDDMTVVNASGSAFGPIDLLSLQDLWVPLRPALLVYSPHPFFLSDWEWPFQDQRYHWNVERRYHTDRFVWQDREQQYTAWLNSQWRWALYRRTAVAAMNRQIGAALRGTFPRINRMARFNARPVSDEMLRTSQDYRQEYLKNPYSELRRWADPENFTFPTQASQALEEVLDLCAEAHIPCLLVESPHHPDTGAFFEDNTWAAYKAELHRLSEHPAVVKLVEMDAYPDISRLYVNNFLHARDARPILAPYFAAWINEALSTAEGVIPERYPGNSSTPR